MSKEAMKLALEALEDGQPDDPYPYSLASKAITSLREALANEDLDKKAENARELGLDYEPAQYSDIVSNGGMDPRNKFDKPAQPRAWFTIDELNAWADKKLKENPQWAEQPAQQEPVAWMFPDDLKRFETSEAYAEAYSIKMGSPTQGETVPLYTSPPAQRTWVGLTDEEMDDCWNKLFGTGNYNRRNVYRAIEAKLKEKNT